MSLSAIWETAAAVLVSLGGGAFIVVAFSAWLGKVWAERLMERERSAHAAELEHLKSKLTHDVSSELELWKAQLNIGAATTLRETGDKLAIYRSTVDLIADVLGDFDFLSRTPQAQVPADRFDHFNRQRMKAYGYMAMLAPQGVMDAFDNLADHLLLVANGQKPYAWSEVRTLANALLNEVRRDVGLDKSPIAYRGKL